MTAFSSERLEQLQGLFPLRDVPRMALAVSLKPHVRNPDAMLVAWLRRAEELDTDRLQPDARSAVPVDPPLQFGEPSDADYAAFRVALINRVLDGLTPFETAELLESYREHFAHLDGGRVGELLDQEIAELRRSGPYWNPHVAQPLLQLSLVPRPHAPQPEGALGGMS